MFKRIFIVLCVMVAFVGSGLDAAGRDVFPFPIQETVLPNGFRIVAVPYDSPGVIAYITVVRTGSREEVEAGCSGFAHFFEHLMFKKTEKFTPEAREKALMLVGAESNAFTSDDYTCYHIVGSANALEKIMEIESDRFMNLSFVEEDIKTEAPVIMGEYKKSSSSPYNMIEEKIRDNAFEAHTYKHTVIGFLKDIEAMPKQFAYSQEFYSRSYIPENCALVVVGDFKQDQLTTLAKKYYGPWKRPRKELKVAEEPPQKAEKTGHIDWKNETLPFLNIGYHNPAFTDGNIEVAALEVFSQLVFSEISPLYKKLVLDEQKVEFVSGSYERHRDPYLFSILSKIKDKKDIDYVKDAIYAAIAEAAAKPVEKEKLEMVKSNLRYSFAMDLDTPQGVAFAVSAFISSTGDPKSINNFYSTLEKVTPEDIQKVASKFFTPENRTIITLTYGGEK